MAIAANQQEFCVECGNFFDQLNSVTGWCEDCSVDYLRHTRTQVEAFLLTHADHIEHYMIQGFSFGQSLDLLRQEIQRFRTCASCGQLIKRASPTAIFCRSNAHCRRLSRRYVYLYQHKGLTKAEALSQVLESLNGSE